MSTVCSFGGLKYLLDSYSTADPHAQRAASIREVFEEAGTAYLGVGIFS